MRFEDALLLVVGLVVGAIVAVAARRLPQGAAQQPADRLQSETAGQEELRDALDELDVGVIALDRELTVTRLNRAAARLMGVDQSRAVGRSLMEMFLDHRVEDAARAAVTQGSAVVELTHVGEDERRLLVRLRTTPQAGLWAFVEDVTELRRLQRIRSEFIDNLSHELRTPLTTIRLLSETLTQDVARPDVTVTPRIRERILKIDVETGHLVQMVNELLDLSRIEGGAAELHFGNVQLADVVDGALDRLRTFADRQRVALETDVDGSALPVVSADEERVGQVLVNLLHNAVKFSPPESVVTISAGVTDGQVAVTVRDQGPGIGRQDLDRIFERFYKVDKARQRGQGGTGLGLAIARHIVAGHGGRIWVESEEGRGAAFTFTVPIAPAVQ